MSCWKPTCDPASNRIDSPIYDFDQNGNMIVDGENRDFVFNADNKQREVRDTNDNHLIQDAQGRSFTFNGDDKQTVVRDLSIPTTTENPDANVFGRYSYDGSGARVKKVTSTETTIFVYDAGGSLAAEYSTQTPPSDPATFYLTTDHWQAA